MNTPGEISATYVQIMITQSVNSESASYITKIAHIIFKLLTKIFNDFLTKFG